MSLAIHSRLRLRKGGGIFDADEIILEITFGEGGDDSKNFVEELHEVYLKYAKGLNFETESLRSELGHVITKITGKGVGQAFKHENGKHVVQRVPITEAKGRKQTSIVSVGILPIRKEMVATPLPESEVEIICQTGKQKAGGQNVNKVASAVRAKHVPTGLSVFINGRDQGQNKREAMNILAARVYELRREASDGEYLKLKREVMGNGSRSDKIRTYNFMRQEVVDHRLNTRSNTKSVMKGDLSKLLRKADGKETNV